MLNSNYNNKQTLNKVRTNAMRVFKLISPNNKLIAK